MEDMELIEKYFRKELNPDESAQFNERLATDHSFKRKFETESLVYKALQFSRERERIKAYAMNPVPIDIARQWLDNKALIMVGGTALAVWIFSTFSSSLTSLAPEHIKWVGLGVAVAGSMFLLAWTNKTMDLRLGIIGVFNGLLVFVTASGIDAINQGTEGIGGKDVTNARLIPFTENKAWWPTQSLEDSLEVNRKRIQEMRDRIKNLVGSHLNAMPPLKFGLAPGRFAIVVVPRSSTVLSGTTYEADVYLASSPLGSKIEMYMDGKPIPVETDPSGMPKGRVSFSATADQFDKTGTARKKFVTEIKLGDSTYTKVVEYNVVKPK